ncbi:hypothetical protein GCM10011594_40360 [Nakamurella endophytica]|uniref:ATPase AAA-type core domain-containing protein n=2 Tax=Nakamurella endophytica TaxID=1748367 RepID=A0A917WN02_9ACTN|nr:hypothetical protein GCM10011594_40360 [Nakamurella endophytica]
MAMQTALQQFEQGKATARHNHWDLSGEFDAMLARMLGEHSSVAIDFVRRFRDSPATAGSPGETTLGKVEQLWKEVFPGRSLFWSDWRPMVRNVSTGAEMTYSGNQMSDGEKAALFLMARVFSAAPGAIIVDEPETHLHSLLAVRLWNAIEAARPDIRFVYVTHDLTFALSRQQATYVLASPTAGLRVIGVDTELPGDVSEALLGSASLSFYASRVVFCEGDASSHDEPFYNAWFNGPDTVVRPVAGYERVLRCVEALRSSGVASALEAVGVIDGDYHAQAFRDALPAGVYMLKVHEIESLFSLPEIVDAVRGHLEMDPLDRISYKQKLQSSVNDDQRRKITIERWKQRLEPSLEGLVSSVTQKQGNIDEIVQQFPDIFDHTKWQFSPESILLEEQKRVDDALLAKADINDVLAVVPGKQMLPLAAQACGINADKYVNLIINTLGRTGTPTALAVELENALKAQLPTRRSVIAGVLPPS